jgi:predicted phosphodiesterase
MKIISYSDLHLEFGTIFRLPEESDADLMILAGDIITFKDFLPLGRFLQDWQKPVLYVTGNHEYYTHQPMQEGDEAFKQWLSMRFPNVTLLQDEAISINGVHFFGGSMWTDFSGANQRAMVTAQHQINDYRYIMTARGKLLRPRDTVGFHEAFLKKLLAWFKQDLSGARVVITHHAPVANPKTQHRNSPLLPAFNSLDMLPIIEKYQPRLWVYGHTHECDDQMIGDTRIISNQLGYPNRTGGFECRGFDKSGLQIEVR